MALCLFVAHSLYGQTSYYYYGNKRIDLEEMPNRSFILLNTEDTNSFLQLLSESARQKMSLNRIDLPLVRYGNAPSMDCCWSMTNIGDLPPNFQNYVYKSSSYCTSQGDTVSVSHLFYVKLKRSEDVVLLASLADNMGVSIVGHNTWMPLWYILSCTRNSAGNALQVANLFYESGLFAATEPDFIGSVKTDCVNDTYASSQWGLDNTGQDGGTAGVDIHYCQAREITQGDANIVVAIVDQGIEFDHPDLNNIFHLSYDTETGTSPSQVLGFHGMHCAGIIGASSNNGIGVAGIAPLSPLMSISNTLNGIPGSNSKRADGINFAWKNGASIISNSWHSSVPSSILNEAIDSALNCGRGGKGCVIVFASGNDSKDSVYYPASRDGVISVGAIDRCGSRAGIADSVPSSCDPWTGYSAGSNYGNKLSLVAPGTNIYTTDNQQYAGYNTMPSPTGDYYSGFGGTSAATPHVAGVAALVLSVNPCLTREEVTYILESTCTKVRPDLYSYENNPNHPNGTWNNQVGHGLVNAYEALLLAQSYLLPDTITTTTTWNEKKRIYSDLIIDSLATLTITDTLYIALDSRIIVRPGGTLVVAGGSLTNACDGEMWEGGIVQATNTLFRNNRRSVGFLDYENHKSSGGIASNVSYFTRCTITIDDANLFAENNDYFYEHI